MTKSQAIAVFGGTGAELARALGVSRSYVSQWPEELPARVVDRILGAAFRLGKEIPQELVAPLSADATRS